MESPCAHTQHLSAEEAKKLYTYLTKPKPPAEWDDEGGASREITLTDVDRSKLTGLRLPKFCSDFNIKGTRDEWQRRKDDLPPTYFLGGDDWFPPEYGDNFIGRIQVVLKELNYPIEVFYSRESGLRFSRKSFNSAVGFGIEFPKVDDYILKNSNKLRFGDYPSLEQQRSCLEGLIKRFDFPNKDTPDILEDCSNGVSSIQRTSVMMVPETCEWFRGGFQAMMKELIEESPSEYYSSYMVATIGGYCQFNGELHKVNEITKDLLDRIARENDIAKYEITYGDIGPCTWSKVTKVKRKVKYPCVSELGIVTLEDGTKGDVSLTTYEDGYSFSVTFENLEDFYNFYTSKLFKKAHWECG